MISCHWPKPYPLAGVPPWLLEKQLCSGIWNEDWWRPLLKGKVLGNVWDSMILVFGQTGQVATELQRHRDVIGLVEKMRIYRPKAVVGSNIKAKGCDYAAAYTAVDKAEDENRCYGHQWEYPTAAELVVHLVSVCSYSPTMSLRGRWGSFIQMINSTTKRIWAENWEIGICGAVHEFCVPLGWSMEQILSKHASETSNSLKVVADWWTYLTTENCFGLFADCKNTIHLNLVPFILIVYTDFIIIPFLLGLSNIRCTPLAAHGLQADWTGLAYRAPVGELVWIGY